LEDIFIILEHIKLDILKIVLFTEKEIEMVKKVTTKIMHLSN